MVIKSLSQYYEDLLTWENAKVQELISIWEDELIEQVQNDFQQAIENNGLINSLYEMEAEIKNQAIGNRIANYLTERLNQNLMFFVVNNCQGQGYPDRILERLADNFRHIAFEIKSTSNWDETDANRRVLTSSSAKLRNSLNPPIYHLLCTVIYQMENDSARIMRIRLDFVQPNTQVRVRLEAMTSHKDLSDGDHIYSIFE